MKINRGFVFLFDGGDKKVDLPKPGNATLSNFQAKKGLFSYLSPEAWQLHDALHGEEDGEDKITVGEDVGVVQGGALVLKHK